MGCRTQSSSSRPGPALKCRQVSPPSRARRVCPKSEAGFTLAALIVILTILAMVIAFTVPRMWSDVLKREREYQTIFVMKQYARAIAEFSKKHNGGAPVSLDQLKEQTSPRVLRALYADPLTGKMDWILVPPGQPATPGQLQPPPNSVPGGTPTPSPSGSPGQLPAGDANYVGPFVGVRPPVTGKAYISLNGQDQYENWIYTIDNLRQDQNPGAVTPGVQPVPTPAKP